MDDKNTSYTPSKEDFRSTDKKVRKKSPFVRIAVMVLILCVVLFGTIIISDMVSKNNNQSESDKSAPEYITLSVSGDVIYLDGKELNLSELRDYFESEKEKGSIPVTAFIIDSKKTADYLVFNQVLDLLSEYGINVDVERMQPPSSVDEIPTSAQFEVLN